MGTHRGLRGDWRTLLLLAILVAGVRGGHASNATAPCDSDNDNDDDDEVRFNEFNSMFFLVLFMVAVWLAGKLAALGGMPGLVGEIACGAALGPRGARGVPFAEGLRSVGNVGLCLLFIEAGLHVDLETLELIGKRGVAVGVGFTLLPLALSFGAAVLAWNASFTEAFVVGAALSTMSTGISLNVLKAGNALNRPIGQLVIAAATCNEILGIAFLGAVRNVLAGQSDVVVGYVVPLILLVALVALVGFLAVRVVPRVLDHVLLPRIPRKRRADAVLAAVFATALALIPACAYSGSSALLGAFLAGLCFCSDRAVHTVWDTQVKRIIRWLLRIFFAATVGFSLVPIGQLLNATSLARAAVVGGIAAWPLGKLAAGFFASPVFSWDDFWTLGFSWGCFGEVAFVIVDLARGEIPDATANAIVVAVVVSIVVAPFGLRRTLSRVEAKARERIETFAGDAADVDGGSNKTRPLTDDHHHDNAATYFCLQTRSPAHLGLTDALVRALSYHSHGREIVDFRSHHPNDHFGAAHCVNEVYLRDATRPAEGADLTRTELEQRRATAVVDAVRQAIVGTASKDDEDAEIRLTRWLPSKHHHHHQHHHHHHGPAGSLLTRESSCSKTGVARGSQHHTPGADHHKSPAQPAEEGKVEACTPPQGGASSPPPPTTPVVVRPAPLSKRILSDTAALLPSRAWLSTAHVLEAPETQTTTFRVRPRHELDGFVHTDAHRLPFDLPDDASDRAIDDALLVVDEDDDPDDEFDDAGDDVDDHHEEDLEAGVGLGTHHHHHRASSPRALLGTARLFEPPLQRGCSVSVDLTVPEDEEAKEDDEYEPPAVQGKIVG